MKTCSEFDLIVIAKPISRANQSMCIDNTELQQITKVLGELKINEIGKNVNFCNRKRVIKPFELLMSLITALGDKSVDTVAMNAWQQQVLATETELSAFKSIVLQDGSSFAVHDSLHETFKGRFTKISPAAIEVHVSWDVLQGYPEHVSVSADSQAEYDFLPEAKSLKDTLFLADRGYFKLSYLDDISQVGGSYVVRARTTVNPMVVSGFNRQGKPLKRFKHKKQKALKKHIRQSGIVDMDVEGKTNYRLIASWPKGKSEPTYWSTNLDRKQFSAETVIKLYQLRWQIELLFKEWKSYCNLQKFNTRKASMMEGLVWVSLLSLIVKRRIGFSVQQVTGIELSTFMIAKNTQGWFYPLMESITQNRLPKLKKLPDYPHYSANIR